MTRCSHPTTISLQDRDVARLEGLIIPVIIKTEGPLLLNGTRLLLNAKDPLGPQLLDFLGVSGVTTEKRVWPTNSRMCQEAKFRLFTAVSLTTRQPWRCTLPRTECTTMTITFSLCHRTAALMLKLR